MLSKILKKSPNDNREPIFPRPDKNELTHSHDEVKVNSFNTNEVCHHLLNNREFNDELKNAVTQNILNILLEKYEFIPTDKYLQQQEEKKKYIKQLDEYLEERKKIKTNVETDLQTFLKNVNDTLANQLNNFSQSISDRIAEAEQKHGIDKLKDILSKNTGVSEDIL